MKVSRIRDVKMPQRANSNDAGIDFFVPNDYEGKWLGKNEGVLIPSGIRVNVPEGHALIAFNKSGVALNKSLVAGAAVVDSDYQGELMVSLFNNSTKNFEINPGDRIAQFMLIPIILIDFDFVEEFEKTERASGGFGHSGTS